ncbi:MAG: dihydrolipoyl dehydrogenase [Candidatus Hodarchaeales archaeon]|jgi:dihydrolipoamide dehydrogenase
MEKIDVLVIGAGPGGYPAAIRAAQLGQKVILVEKEHIGGECLNWGCIPSKALIYAANFYHDIQEKASTLGISYSDLKINMQSLQKWKQEVQANLIGGINQLLKANKVTKVKGTAKFLNQHEIEIISSNGKKSKYAANYIIIATGTIIEPVDHLTVDEKGILSAKGLLSLSSIPESLICIGRDPTTLELGILFSKLGSKITFITQDQEILPDIDTSVSRLVKMRLKKIGFELKTETGKEKIKASHVFVNGNKLANTENLGLKSIGVTLDDQGFIVTNKKQQTNISHIFAAGDCTGNPFFAHRAIKQGIIASEVVSGLSSEYDFRSMPYVIFTDPEIAIAGLSEKAAKDLGYEITVSRSNYGASGRALTQLSSIGFVKHIKDKNSGVLLGTTIVGSLASELISEASVALEMGALVEDLGYTIHPHPTLSEILMESADASLRKAIHQVNRNR